jgi:hypothetical protein
VLGGKHAAPGLPQQVVVVLDPQRRQQVVQLGEEQLDGPELRALLGQVGGPAVAELVVVDHRATGLLGQVGDRQ